MSKQLDTSPHTIQPIMHYVEKAYFEYANYVIHDRALPFIGDGLKPVARRIIYAMRELFLHATAKHKKSARTVGDVLGKFHPHGDTACYEAMVLMAQSFSYRYPFIDGQGNWGSIDEPKSFAAMRYTEARLSHYAEALLSELGPDTVAWLENFDGSLKEPQYLPARLPNVILNGAMGIAVGIATDIAPHNIHEIVAALLEIIHRPDCDDDAILQHIQGPDLPTGGILISTREDILTAYTTGQGNYRVRAVCEITPKTIIITALPYQVSSAKIMRQIADLILSKKLHNVEDIRDDSDEEHPVRIVLMLKGKAETHIIMETIYAYTECEKSYRIQQYVLNNEHKPHLFTLPELLREWLVFRKKVVTNRIKSDIEALATRLHILEGLKIITLHIDEVIRIIRYEDDPDAVLMEKFSLTAQQVKAILEIRLKQLTKVEWLSLESEYQKKQAQKDALLLSLNSPEHFKKLLEHELTSDAKQFGNPRRTIIQPQSQAIRPAKIVQIIPREEIKVFLSQEMWIRASRNLSTRADSLVYHSSDHPYLDAQGMTDHIITLWSAQGQVYSVKMMQIPSVRGKGEPLSTWLDMQGTIIAMHIGEPQEKLFIITTDGYGFVTTMASSHGRLRSGKTVVRVPQGQSIQSVCHLHSQISHVALLTRQGRLLIIPIAELPELKKGRGLKIVHLLKKDILQDQDGVIQCSGLRETDTILCMKGEQQWTQKPSLWQKLMAQRGQRGHLLPRNFRSTLTVIEVQGADLTVAPVADHT